MAERIIEMPDGHGMGTTHIRERIVRCRDCDFSRENGTLCILFAGWEPIASGDEYELVNADVEPDGFCKWGVRRTDG